MPPHLRDDNAKGDAKGQLILYYYYCFYRVRGKRRKCSHCAVCGSRAPLRKMRAAYKHYTFLYIALLLRYSTTRTRNVTNIVVRPAAHGNRLKTAYGKIACVDRARNPPPLGSLLLNAVGTLLNYSFRRELTSKECAVLPCHHPRFLFLTRLNRTGFVGPSDGCKVSCFPNRSEQNVSISRPLS